MIIIFVLKLLDGGVKLGTTWTKVSEQYWCRL